MLDYLLVLNFFWNKTAASSIREFTQNGLQQIDRGDVKTL